MIDHEVRFLTNSTIEVLKKKLKSEKILISKIPYKFVKDKNFQKDYIEYFLKAKKINEVYLRGLPLNEKNNYETQERQLMEEFQKINHMLKKKLIVNQVMQIPNPENIKFKDFEKIFLSIKKVKGFELISSWHNKKSNDKIYEKYLGFVNELQMPLSIEVDYFFRDSLVSLANFFNVIKKFPNIKYWLPHLGCGAFLHWDKILNICEKSPSLMTSTVNYNLWADVLKLPYYRKISLKYASDHPFNSKSSIKIYNYWKNKF
tara:strand:+ start:819 stop:1598 length:780 start_codon:yes stop_codon:yes gene_type:complete